MLHLGRGPRRVRWVDRLGQVCLLSRAPSGAQQRPFAGGTTLEVRKEFLITIGDFTLKNLLPQADRLREQWNNRTGPKHPCAVFLGVLKSVLHIPSFYDMCLAGRCLLLLHRCYCSHVSIQYYKYYHSNSAGMFDFWLIISIFIYLISNNFFYLLILTRIQLILFQKKKFYTYILWLDFSTSEKA